LHKKQTMKYYTARLSNGIRFVHMPTNRPVSHLGVIVNTGSRDELEQESGIAHYIEHILFKGTKNRKAYHILSRMEDVGGEIDAYTTKEDTVIYTSFLENYYERAADLLSDILFNSVFPEKEIIKEKEVIYDEIASYLDSPSEQIYDDFENNIYRGHSLGRNILGDKKSLFRFTKKDVQDFMARTYNTDQMVICSIGSLSMDKAEKIIQKYFSFIKENKRNWNRKAFTNYQDFNKTEKKDTHQAHCILGNIAYSSFDDKGKYLILLNNLLGGPGLNSRLNLLLREKYAWVYNIESNYARYSGTGVWSVYFGSDKENYEKVLIALQKELQNMADINLGPRQLEKAKQQIIGQMALSSENNQEMLLGMGKNYLLYNHIDSFEEIKEKVYSISVDDIRLTSQEIFNPKKLSSIIFI